MGIYAEYLTKLKNFEEITKERKKILSNISKLRGHRDVLVFASDSSKGKAPIGIEYTDLLAVQDQLENLSGEAIDSARDSWWFGRSSGRHCIWFAESTKKLE